MRSWFNIDSSINVQIPNEIFEDFHQAEFESFNHKCFAYAYYYVVSYLYRNALYGTRDVSVYSQSNIISLSTTNKSSISYITKKGGLLDSIGYTRTTTDYPIAPYMDNGILEFETIKSLRKRMSDVRLDNNPRFTIKEPVKAIVRFDDEDCTGTFYSFQSTHRIDIMKFITIIADDQLGHVGLYVYGYLNMMFDRFPMGYTISNADLAKVVGCSERTINSYTNRLESLGLISSSRKTIGSSKRFEKSYCVI
ncbi:winged helix-turn-helix transcriptional regulator [Paenibacillus macquariensis]|uniref:Helix-turn-helix domain-containing protein n=1 Tax=Paenibacillus macquariensis TaxID=948756 RepID=A0ABY1JKB5_9BACL|nr:helix-turn-helix domain-containing protein [Paenibacillus macquariensis]MEC0089893.1 helix-turn-helix domain-containing protein [Paenibacillus macquariensis]SIQ33757.1 Helix-turn-helix domain-containing protein [Paenibacillus macquariensis]